MHKLLSKQIFGPDIGSTRYVVFIDHGGSFGQANVSAAQLAAIAPLAACQFKLPRGATATVEVYKDEDEPKHIFNVQIVNAFAPLPAPPSVDSSKETRTASRSAISGRCFAECPDGSGIILSRPCNDILNESAVCDCSSDPCVVNCQSGSPG